MTSTFIRVKGDIRSILYYCFLVFLNSLGVLFILEVIITLTAKKIKRKKLNRWNLMTIVCRYIGSTITSINIYLYITSRSRSQQLYSKILRILFDKNMLLTIDEVLNLLTFSWVEQLLSSSCFPIGWLLICKVFASTLFTAYNFKVGTKRSEWFHDSSRISVSNFS